MQSNNVLKIVWQLLYKYEKVAERKIINIVYLSIIHITIAVPHRVTRGLFEKINSVIKRNKMTSYFPK